MLMPSIIITSGKQKGRFCRLGQTTNVIGRDENLPIQILDDTISRRHLQILFDHRTWLYAAEDMGSRNGVLINGRKIEKETVLNDGDIIKIGNTQLMFTNKDFFDRKSTLDHIRRIGQKNRPTKTD